MNDKTETKAAAPAAKKDEWVAKVPFSAELHKEERAFAVGEPIPGNVSQTTLDSWEERELIEKAP